MQVVVLQENLKRALNLVNKIVSSKTQLPVLNNVLLEAEPGKLKLVTTNLESSMSFWIGATVEKTGAFTVPARLLTELVGTFTQDRVSLTKTNTLLVVVCGESEATISGIEAGEFPPLPKAETKRTALFKKEQLEGSLPLVMFAASNDESRPLLTGVRMVKQAEAMVLVATDGFRLSVKKIPQISGIEKEMVIPARVLNELVRVMHDEQATEMEMFFSQDKNQALFSLGNAQIITRMIEGEFPNYEKIIPKSFATRAKINKDDFIRAVKFAGVYAKESANILRINLTDDGLLVSANLPQIGENKTRVVATVEGEKTEIAFNTRFLLDLLAVFPDSEVIFEMSGPLAPGVFKSAKDDSFLHIIMPVRVQG